MERMKKHRWAICSGWGLLVAIADIYTQRYGEAFVSLFFCLFFLWREYDCNQRETR